MKLDDLCKKAELKTRIFFKHHSPEILTGIGIAGMITTTVMAVQATPKALQLLDAKKEELDVEELEAKEMVQATWQCYAPAIIVGVSTIACFASASYLSYKSQASLVSAYSLLDQHYKKYRTAAKEVYGEDADEKINAQMAEDVWIHDGSGEYLYLPDADKSDKLLFYDDYTNTFFYATAASVTAAHYHLNRNLALGGEVSVNDYKAMLGLPHIDGCDDVGWCIDLIYQAGYSWLDFTNIEKILPDGRVYYVIGPVFEPTALYDYDF
ncbi:MAG: DUF6353 family protein [Bacillota bacterium]